VISFFEKCSCEEFMMRMKGVSSSGRGSFVVASVLLNLLQLAL
jgi:hypothetical protein